MGGVAARATSTVGGVRVSALVGCVAVRPTLLGAGPSLTALSSSVAFFLSAFGCPVALLSTVVALIIGLVASVVRVAASFSDCALQGICLSVSAADGTGSHALWLQQAIRRRPIGCGIPPSLTLGST